MFEWSKKICKKIKDANCLNDNEMQTVEIALRMHDLHEEALNECLDLSKENLFELKYSMYRNN